MSDPVQRPPQFERTAALLRALANPVRLALLAAVAEEARCVHELVDATATPQPVVSQHLRVLREAQLVVAERRGREVAYSLADAHVARMVADAHAHAQE